ncbi:hypothetical protein HMPREF9630_01596 [Peptoanaerobacter stomatis]|uniref:Lipoprotein n=1 Tax=Peptoanaerobacter stomatis TaxID=796937 RepID=V9HR40_9FIRM|nr:hypothetical protein [Peptoanaerobacter stomatis]EHL17584.1 hypothetical protein HMPREF9630_01596 [Peptoanaerobacter stomatis]
MKKKILALLMAGLMGLTMVACGGGSTGGNSGIEQKKAKDVEFGEKIETEDFTVDIVKDWKAEKEDEEGGGNSVNADFINDDVFASVSFLISTENVTQEEMDKEVREMMKAEGEEEPKEVEPITIDGVKLKGLEMTEADSEFSETMKSMIYYGFAKEKPFAIIIVDGNDGKENSKIAEIWSMVDTIKFK